MGFPMIVMVLCLVIAKTQGTLSFTSKHYEERMCPNNILIGYENCLCDYEKMEDKFSDNPGYQLKSVNCTNQEFTEIESIARLRQFSQMLTTHGYTDLEHFTFVGNTVRELPVNIVGKTSLENLMYLDLSNNSIHTIHGKTFHSMPDLIELHLDNNDWYVDVLSPRVFSSIYNIEVLSLNDAFSTTKPNNSKINHVTVLSRVFEDSKLDYLKELYLERNNLMKVDSYVFQNLISLQKVSLAHNFISSLDGLLNSTCFPSNFVEDYMGQDHKCQLQYLDLSYNYIRTLPKGFLNELGRVKNFSKLILTGNPFKCDCNLLDFFDWLKNDIDLEKYTIPHHKTLKCASPLELLGRPIVSLDREELTGCPKLGKSDKNHGSHAGTIVLVLLFGIIALAVLVVLYIYRSQVAFNGNLAITYIKSYVPTSNHGYKNLPEPLKEPVSV